MKKKFHSFLTAIRKPKVGYPIIAVGILLFAGVSWYAVEALSPKPRPYAPIVITKKPAPKETFYSTLNGIKIASKDDIAKPVTAVMIENSPDARPHSGLAEAEVVYEAVAEGGITRFLVLYQQHKPSLIGPVRSLREYFVDWLAPYEASVAHVGGSAAALREIRNGSYRDIDQFFNAGYYWRASDRYAPHNVYTNSSKLATLNNAKGYSSSSFKSFTRQDTPKDVTPNATKVMINFSSPTYNTVYTYDKDSNTYTRAFANAPHKDREKGNITPSVVVALKVSMNRIEQDGYREHITTTGSGEAVVFQNGTATNVTWRKDGRKAPLQLLDTDGKPFALNRGQTWIAAVPVNQRGSVSWQ